jgi:hypothetical protein
MAEEIPPADGRLENPSVRHEPTDASFRWVMYLLGAALVCAIVIFVALWLFFEGYSAHQARVKKSPYPLAPTPSTALPPEPRLEQLDRQRETAGASVYERQQAKEAILQSYGPTGEKGFVHIPIDQAMRALANKLLAPVKPPGQGASRANGLVNGGASNSGRLLRKEPQWYER